MDRDQILNDQITMLKTMMDGRQASMWTAIPGIVTAVNWETITCTVQPAIQSTITDESGTQTPVDLPLLLDVPIVFPQGGGFLITIPIAVGDEVLVVFSSRCIDAWWQNGGPNPQPAMEARMHDLSDAFAIPGPFSQAKLPAGPIPSSTDIQIRNAGGDATIGITPDGFINLYSGSVINITAPAVNISGTVVVTGTVACGALTCASLGTTGSGAAAIGGALSAASVVAGGKDLATHIHSGVTVGIGVTGPPV